ncbi:MAG: methyltransferase domain-containing protein [Lachnospiraceae bacterium]|nr:methyltransferase domain-containing protein [Lachnospiraceae bacterium]
MSIRTNYEKWYEGDDYYWGTEPGSFLDELADLNPPSAGKKVLDIGCGEGKDAVYMAQKGYEVSAFDLTENGIRKTIALAETRNVRINAYVDDINSFDISEQYDIIYSTGTVQYLFDENKADFFRKLEKITRPDGVVFINVFVEKPFLELPPDWDKEEKMWKPGELFTYFADWKFERIDEVIFEDQSGGVPHYHCMDTIICRKIKEYVQTGTDAEKQVICFE